MRIAITGYRGQLGEWLVRRLEGHELLLLGRPEHDITQPESIVPAIVGFRPDVVIHSAAFTNVDGCARDPDTAYLVNALGTQNVAAACQKAGAAMVYISTNEVFDGTKGSPYLEQDERHPINPYGWSKYAGERFVETLLERFYIVRIAWLFAPGRVNFVSKICALARERGRLSIVTDEISSPTYAPHLADALARLIETGHYGVYHLANEGSCSRYEFARYFLPLAGLGHVPVEPITSDQFQRPSRPPLHCILRNFAAAHLLGIQLPPWEEAVQDYFRRLEGA
ncbi:MAG: dTDP-4-dehydrorhamnose reductase [Anaerolineae bacterium]